MTSVTPTLPARERLLAAADKLFYAEGINTVGIDRVIEEADVAKATLYASFGSKEALVVAYLQRRLERRQERTMNALAQIDEPRDRLVAVFDVLDEYIHEPGFNGCAFINATAEAQAGSAIELAVRAVRVWMLALLTDLARDAGADQPPELARQLALLYDGAIVAAHMDDDPNAARAARDTACVLVDAATHRRRSKR